MVVIIFFHLEPPQNCVDINHLNDVRQRVPSCCCVFLKWVSKLLRVYCQVVALAHVSLASWKSGVRQYAYIQLGMSHPNPATFGGLGRHEGPQSPDSTRKSPGLLAESKSLLSHSPGLDRSWMPCWHIPTWKEMNVRSAWGRFAHRSGHPFLKVAWASCSMPCEISWFDTRLAPIENFLWDCWNPLRPQPGVPAESP